MFEHVEQFCRTKTVEWQTVVVVPDLENAESKTHLTNQSKTQNLTEFTLGDFLR